MRRIRLVAALALAAALTAPASSLAGGFATVGLSSLPDDARPGEAWVVDLTVLQHGRTPLDGLEPAIVIAATGSGAVKRFAAKPTGAPGVYRARVLFPAKGEWRYAADDGFTAVHEFGTVRVGSESPAATPATPATPVAPAASADAPGGVGLLEALGIAALAGLLAALAVGPLRRRFTKVAEG